MIDPLSQGLSSQHSKVIEAYNEVRSDDDEGSDPVRGCQNISNKIVSAITNTTKNVINAVCKGESSSLDQISEEES